MDLIKDYEEKRDRFNYLSRTFAGVNEVMKAFDDMWEAKEKAYGKQLKRSIGDRTNNVDYSNEKNYLYNL